MSMVQASKTNTRERVSGRLTQGTTKPTILRSGQKLTSHDDASITSCHNPVHSVTRDEDIGLQILIHRSNLGSQSNGAAILAILSTGGIHRPKHLLARRNQSQFQSHS